MKYCNNIYKILKNAGCVYKSTFDKQEPLTLAHIATVLKYVPKAIQKKLYDFVRFSDYDEGTSLHMVLNEADNHGVLHFNPYVTDNENRVPTLVLSYDRYVHLYRGYYFQVSYTSNGTGSIKTAGVRLDDMFYQFKPSMRNSKLFQLLAYMNLLDAGRGIIEFDKLLSNDIKTVDNFFAQAYEYWYNTKSCVSYSDLESIVKDVVHIQDFGADIFRIPLTETRDICRLFVHTDFNISICYANKGSITNKHIILPKIDITDELVQESGFNTKEEADVWITSYIYSNPNVRLQFILFVLYCANITFDDIGKYSKKDVNVFLRRLYDYDTKDITAVEQFYLFFKKEYDKAVINAAFK